MAIAPDPPLARFGESRPLQTCRWVAEAAQRLAALDVDAVLVPMHGDGEGLRQAVAELMCMLGVARDAGFRVVVATGSLGCRRLATEAVGYSPTSPRFNLVEGLCVAYQAAAARALYPDAWIHLLLVKTARLLAAPFVDSADTTLATTIGGGGRSRRWIANISTLGESVLALGDGAYVDRYLVMLALYAEMLRLGAPAIPRNVYDYLVKLVERGASLRVVEIRNGRAVLETVDEDSTAVVAALVASGASIDARAVLRKLEEVAKLGRALEGGAKAERGEGRGGVDLGLRLV